MKAVIYSGTAPSWTRSLGGTPWLLVPLANRPLLDFWMEWCLDLGVSEVRLVLGDSADQIEAYAEEGRRWGLRIGYSFLRDDRPPVSFLKRDPAQWRGGLLFLSGPLFPRRLPERKPGPSADGETYGCALPGGDCLLSRDPAFLDAFIAGERTVEGTRPFRELGIEPAPLASIRAFFDLNLQLAEGEVGRYVTPGYGAGDGSFVGYNVVIPPSARVAAPVVIGNDCRIGALASVGPSAVIGNHVVIDRQTDLRRCVILDGTYVGRGVELRDKIATGRRLIDPDDGAVLDLEDPWLLAEVKRSASFRDVGSGVAGWLLALALLVLQAVPFVLLYGWLRCWGAADYRRRVFHGPNGRVQSLGLVQPSETGRSSAGWRLFFALGLDLFPRLGRVAAGRLWLCGHEPLRAPEDNALRETLPAYYPAVFSYATPRFGESEPAVTAVQARYYAHRRCWREDWRIFGAVLVGRAKSLLGEGDRDA